VNKTSKCNKSSSRKRRRGMRNTLRERMSLRYPHMRSRNRALLRVRFLQFKSRRRRNSRSLILNLRRRSMLL